MLKLFAIAGLLMLCQINALSKGVNDELFSKYVGRLISASLRFPPDSFRSAIAEPNGESVEAVLESLDGSSDWKKFSYEQKREFTLIALLYCNVEGGSLTDLIQLLGKDSKQVTSDLQLIPDQVLIDRVHFNPEGIKTFREQSAFLSGQTKDKRDSK